MKWPKWTWKQWTALSAILLVLVISSLAYSVFVPKLNQLEKAQARLDKVIEARDALLDAKVPKRISEDEKTALALQVPVSLEQSRFIRLMRDAEQDAGVVIKTLSFLDQNAEEEEAEGNDSTAAKKAAAAELKPKPKTSDTAGTLLESRGRLSVSGDYAQVRKFFELFTKTERLVTFNKWSLSTEEVRDRTVSITTRSVPVYAPNTPQPSQPPTTKTSQTVTAPTREDLLKAVEALNRPLLKDVTPLYARQEYDRVVESVMAKLMLSNTQRDKDLANLEIQQATNRFQAGQEGKQEAVLLVDQERAQAYVSGAHTNIREVLLTTVTQPGANTGNRPPASGNNNASPLYFLNIPTEVKPSNKLLKVVVKVEIEFTIYQAPGAKQVLPELDSLTDYKPAYEPAFRSNPVESK